WDAFDVTAIEDFLPNAALTANGQPPHDNPMDMEIGPDGSMYVLDYGDGFFRANPDAGLYRIDYVAGNKSPQASFTATPMSSSTAPLTVEFDATASVDPDGDEVTYQWDFDGDGTFDATGATASHTYTEIGNYTARLRVSDPAGRFGLTTRTISVGNQAPEVTIAFPENGAFFDWGQAIPFQVTTSDAEDGDATDCARVAWTYGLGHDEHAHPEVSGTGCTGVFRTDPNSPEHGPGALLYGAVVVTYTDRGANGLPAATGEATLRLNPKEQQAEHAIRRQGVVNYADATASGGNAVRGLGAGDFLAFDPVSFAGIDGAVIRANGAGEVQLRWGAADAEPFATAAIPAGQGWQDVEIAFDAPEGTGALYVTSGDELALDALTMVGDGVGDVTAPTVAHTLAPAAPTGVGGVYNEPVRFSVQAADNGTLASVQYSRDNGATWSNLAAGEQYGVTFSENGTYDIRYRATDTGGNVSELGSATFTIDLDAPNEPTVESRTLVTLASPRATYGAPGDVTVSVRGDGGVPSGEVVLTAGERELGRAALDADGNVVFALPADLPVGTHTLRATYGADETFIGSAGIGRLTVSQARSTTALEVAPNPVKPAVAATATVKVTSSTGIAPTGEATVTVRRNNAVVATLTGTLGADGSVRVTLPKLGSVGSYQVQAAYTGSTGVAKSSAITGLTVAR
ncbi:MAG: PKD domain-containing protein, partial [Actinobacteria bacterium]|nr:PKD domain-containing protein [Actinomycetota bacterium]